MCVAVVPQQPPIRLTPSSATKRSSQLASSAATQRIMRVAIDQFRQPGIRQHRQQSGPVVRQPADMLGHFLRAGGAVQPHQRHVQRVQHRSGGGDVGADQHRAGGLHCHLREDRHVAAGFGTRDLGAVHRGLHLQRVLAGFHHDRIHATRDKAAALLRQRRFQRVIGDVAEARQLGAGADAAQHPAMPAVAEFRRRLARQLAGDAIDFEGAVGELEFVQRDRGAAEAVGFHHVGAGGEIAAMDVADHVGARQVQDLGAVLPAPEVAVDVERQGLNMRAHGAVGQQDGITQDIEQVGAGHRVSAGWR